MGIHRTGFAGRGVETVQAAVVAQQAELHTGVVVVGLADAFAGAGVVNAEV